MNERTASVVPYERRTHPRTIEATILMRVERKDNEVSTDCDVMDNIFTLLGEDHFSHWRGMLIDAFSTALDNAAKPEVRMQREAGMIKGKYIPQDELTKEQQAIKPNAS